MAQDNGHPCPRTDSERSPTSAEEAMSGIIDALTVGADALSESLADSRAKEADAVIPDVRKIVEECKKRSKKKERTKRDEA